MEPKTKFQFYSKGHGEDSEYKVLESSRKCVISETIQGVILGFRYWLFKNYNNEVRKVALSKVSDFLVKDSEWLYIYSCRINENE